MRRPSRFRTTPGRALRVAAVMLGFVLLAATFAAGTRFSYCTAMGPLGGARCACTAEAPRAAPDLTIQSTDCHRVVTVGALPVGTRAAPGASVPLAPVAALLPPRTGRSVVVEPSAVLAASDEAQQRAGPGARDARARLMVFLL